MALNTNITLFVKKGELSELMGLFIVPDMAWSQLVLNFLFCIMLLDATFSPLHSQFQWDLIPLTY